ncbi:MAG: alpha/beta hydrolase [Sulfurovum sp.]|nr:alpha/beta hydrolase [Sulfurovum sp.]MCB4760134.1 alpha/beta hydrolase [Sulfurovum sp.]MCB4763919.1 alpha/beta hydrolase [Sulfurovum sp.]MCB4778886.1 alpha/beta hydrolase [Sulfurovum sp.]MCB4781820.1 alpha/beta hydrolase [Sulfurovum sp.]
MQTVFIIVGLLLLIGIPYEQYARYKAKKNYPIIGDFVDVGGHKLHYVKKGSGDTATIVFESGADFGGHVVWKSIQAKLSQNFTTLSYDRVGILHSQRGDNPKDVASISDELHTMLEKLDLPKPYIFVGHSLAGLTLRAFVNKYPEHVVGMVLLDPTHPDALEMFSKKIQKMYTSFPPQWLISILLPLGIIRILFTKLIAKFTADAIPSEKENYEEALAYIDKGFQAYAEEFTAWKSLSQETKGLEFNTIPVVLLGATKPPLNDKAHIEGLEVMKKVHQKTVESSPNGKYIPVDSAHTIQFEQPDFVVETVERFAKEILK